MKNERKIPFERRCEIGERLREFRQSQNMTQDQMAEILGVSKTFYGQAERGISSLGEHKLLILSDKFNADIGYILTGRKFYYTNILDYELQIPEKRIDSICKLIELFSNMP